MLLARGAAPLFRAQILEVAVGKVGGEEEVGDAGPGSRRRRRRPSPRASRRRRCSPGEEPREDQRHDHLRHTAAEVAPAGGGGVGRADAVRREHHRRVVLSDDERRADRTDAEPEQQERLVARRARPMPITGRTEHQQERVAESRGPMRSQSQPMIRRARIVIATEAMIVLPICALVRLELLAHDRHQRRDAEPREEAEEEGEPRHVERPHRAGPQAEQVDAGCLVTYVHLWLTYPLRRSDSSSTGVSCFASPRWPHLLVMVEALLEVRISARNEVGGAEPAA